MAESCHSTIACRACGFEKPHPDFYRNRRVCKRCVIERGVDGGAEGLRQRNERRLARQAEVAIERDSRDRRRAARELRKTESAERAAERDARKAAKAAEAEAWANRSCRDCGHRMTGRRIVCDQCRREVRRAKHRRNAASRRKRRAAKMCSGCGAELLGLRASGPKTRCEPCRNQARETEAQRRAGTKQRRTERLAAERKRLNRPPPSWPHDAHVRRYRDVIRARQRSRANHSTPKGRLEGRLKTAIKKALRGRKNGRRWESLVGYSLDDLHQHLERQFRGRMSWANMGRWHIDHIVPRAAFNYAEASDPDFKACWALSNLRPLWGKANMQKSDKRLTLL
jgi:hypothetical protein